MTLIKNVLSFVTRWIPTVFTFTCLGLVAYWGHVSGWKAPAFTPSRGSPSQEATKEDWCDKHNVPESRCVACHPELAGADPKDWCKEHGVPESRCTVCHPDRAQAKDWCSEHGVPESQCTVCHPDLALKDPVPLPKSPIEVTSDVPTPKISKARDPKTCQTHHLRVQFASREAVEKCGIQVASVTRRPMREIIKASGTADYDQTHVAHLSSKVSGTVWRLFKQLGQPVARGEALALVDSLEVGRAKADFLQALAQEHLRSKIVLRLQSAAHDGYRSRAELEEAESSLREARIRVINAQQALSNLGLPVPLLDITSGQEAELADRMKRLGLPASLLESLDPAQMPGSLLPVVAPFDGTVITREAVVGEIIDTTKPLFTVADTRRMWVLLDVKSEDSSRLAFGQDVMFVPDGTPDRSVTGKISWIRTSVDPKTRTIQVRIEVDNVAGDLRAGTFGQGRITLRDAPDAVTIPEDCLQWEGCCHIVFVRVRDDLFQTRKVRLGARCGGFVEILVGVLPGENVAAAGSHVLKSEILKSALGAGCVDD